MPDRRPDPSEFAPDRGDDTPEATDAPDTDGDDESFEAVTDRDRSEANRVFQTLVDAGFVPAQGYDIRRTTGGEVVVSASVILPHTIDGGE